MLDILLVVVIGGMGTIYGAVIGSVLFVIAQNYLQDLLKLGASAAEGVPCWPRWSRRTAGCSGWACCSCCSVYHFPTGVVGRLRAWRARRT